MSLDKPITLFNQPRAVWDAMLADLETASQTIRFDQYILKQDEVGQRLLRIFRDKARDGVKVQLLLDRVGSRDVYTSSLVKDIREAGGDVRFFNDLAVFNLFTPHKWFPRNHVKTMVIDRNIAYVGSACCDDDMADWRDMHVRMTGDFAAYIDQHFDEQNKPRNFARDVRKADEPCRYIVSQPGVKINPIYREILRRIYRAQKRIILVSPYFLPPIRLRLALRKAVKRGVEVSVMVGDKTDVPFADCVSTSFFKGLLRHGVKIYAYKPSILHAKYTVIDNEWATIGSCNIDYLSLFRNREANLVTLNKDIVTGLTHQFADDLKVCQIIDRAFCEGLPLWYRVLGLLGRSVKKFL